MKDKSLAHIFIKGVMSTGIGTFISITLGLVNILIAVRSVSKSQLGVYVLVIAVVGALGVVTDFGLNVSTVRHLASSETKARKDIVGSVVCYKLIISLVLAVLILLGTSLLADGVALAGVKDYMPFVATLLILETLNDMLSALLQGVKNYKKMALAKILTSVTNCALIVAMVNILMYGLTGLMVSRIVALIVSILFQLRSIWEDFSLHFDKKIFSELFSFGYPLGLNGLLSLIFLRVDTFMIGAFLNPASVAAYGVATKIPDTCRQIFEAFRSVYFPSIAELFALKMKEDANQLLNNSLRIISFSVIFSALGVYLFQNEIVMLLFTREYIESAPILAVLMLAMGIGLISNIMGTSLVAAGYSRLPVMINIVDTCVSLIANLILIPLFGIIGAASAALLSRFITNPVNAYFLKKNDIALDILNYVKPLGIYLICILTYTVFDSTAVLVKMLILSEYVLFSFMVSVINVSDLRILLSSAGYYQNKGVIKSGLNG